MSTTIGEALSNPATYEQAREAVHMSLIVKAHEIVVRNLEAFGNDLGELHRDALVSLVGGFTLLAFGIMKGRYAYPLPTGMGKTQSIVAWCAALEELGYKDVSVAIAASKVEALCQLKRDLIRNGVPPESIGLIHSYRFDSSLKGELLDGYASEPSTEDNDDRPIMLVTHNRTLHKNNLCLFNEYQGKPRNLLIWDESLLVSNSRAIDLMGIRRAIGHLTPVIGDGSQAARYIYEAIASFEAEIKNQKDSQEPQLVNLTPLSAADMDIIKRQIGQQVEQEALRKFIDISQNPLRVACTEQGGGLIYYDIALPLELENIIILDASYPIRELELMDKTIKSGKKYLPDMKRYDHVNIHHLKSNAGRGSITKSFSNKENNKVSSEVCKLVAGIPSDEGVIIFTFKKREGRKSTDFKGVLKRDLKEAGVDVDAQLPKGSRIVMLTWGQETSLSEYSYCKHVVFAGVLHRSHLDLASYIAGQTDDILYKTSATKIKEVMNSEIAHNIYQGLSRGSCRMISGNQAHKMDAWLIHGNDEIRPLIEAVMPGVKWLTWEGSYLLSTNTQSKIAKSIKDYLKGLPLDVPKTSTSAIKKATGLTEDKVPKMTFTRALEDVLIECDEWELENRSVIRVNFASYFTDNLSTNP